MSDEVKARRAFDRHEAWDSKANEMLVQASVLVIRSLLLLNGGAAIAILAFLSSTISSELAQPYANLVAGMVGTLPLFGFGAFFAVLSAGSSYLSTYMYMWSEREVTFHWEPEYIRPKPITYKSLRYLGHAATVAAIGCAFASASFFLFALLVASKLAAGG